MVRNRQAKATSAGIRSMARFILLSGLILAPIFSATADSLFSISADGTEVTDNRTGLIWQRCPIGMTWDNTVSNCSGSPTYMMWYESLHVAVNTARSENLAWRIPNVKELTGIVDRTSINPAINTQVFPSTPNHQFWSASPYAADAFFAWLVDFYDGAVLYSYLEDMGVLRLVRDPG